MKERFTYDSAKIRSLLDGIYDGTITEYSIPEDLYVAIADYLKSGLYQGFGGDLTKFSGKDLALLEDLRTNVYAFSGGKSYQQIKEYRSLLLNEAGELRPQKEFTQLGEQAFETWNEAWGLSEHGTCVHNAMMANKWNEIEKNKDLLPNLSYQTIGDACDICAPLDGLIAPVDDPIWDSIMPTNHFNCLCIVLQEDSDATLTPEVEKNDTFDKVNAEMSDTFKMNPGKDKEIFSRDHPYFDIPKKDIELAKNNFNLPIPSVESETGKQGFKEAKTIDEAKAYSETLGIKKDWTVVNLDARNEINKDLAELKTKYKDELQTLGNEKRPRAMASANAISMNFNTKYFDNLKYFEKVEKEAAISRYNIFEQGNPMKSAIHHEYGHVLSYRDIQRQTDIGKEFTGLFKRYRNDLKKFIATGENINKFDYISGYAGKDTYEFVAESFAMTTLEGQKISKYANAVKTLIDKYYSK